jgi:hypothetical protein
MKTASKTASLIIGGRSKTVKCRTIKNRKPFWVVARDTYGHEEVILKTRHEDSARVAHQRRVEDGGDYSVSIINNIIEWD